MKQLSLLANIFVLIVSILNIRLSNGFNLDTKQVVFKKMNKYILNNDFEVIDNKDIYFGYSVAQHVVKSTKTPFLLVGAPKDSLNTNGNVFNMSGAIYKCPINLNRIDDCEQVAVNFETKKSDEFRNNLYLDDYLKEQFKGSKFENQWFGVSLSSTGFGSFSACAHKYVHYYNFTNRDEHAAYGACYRFANDFVQEYKHVPCLTYSHAVSTFYFNNYAYCQAGTSLSMIEDQTLAPVNSLDTYLIYGMPGALNFRGLVGVKAISRTSSTEYLYKNKSNLCKFDIETDKPTYDGYCPNLWEKYSYTGMSHAMIRRYMNKDKTNLIAAGAPRENLYGLVRFFTIMFDVSFGQLTKMLNVTLNGIHKGSSFGFSMASCDVNGDQIEDLIVGAPYYSRKAEPNVGSIYVYLNDKYKGFTDAFVFNYTGQIHSQFGHSISCLGDIDKDGYSDFAIGAPFESNPSSQSNGAVYIFRGRKLAKDIKLSQKILAKDIDLKLHLSSLQSTNESILNAFGYSLSGGIDMDSNGYPDLAVGAFKSNAVVLLRSKPILHIKSYVNNNQSIQEIDQKIKQCKQDPNSNSNDTVCFDLQICFELFNNVDINTVNEKLPSLNYIIEIEPNSTLFNSRAYFKETNNKYINKSIQINVNAKSCETFNVYIKKDNNDFVKPIKFEMIYKFVDKSLEQDSTSFEDLKLNELKSNPMIHEDTNKYEFEASFKKDCGPDKVCFTDLSLNADFVDLLVGDDNIPLISFKESDTVTLTISLKNNEIYSEPAYATQIEIDFDDRLDFIRKIDQESSGFTCAINQKKKINSLLCQMPNDLPFAANHSIKFDIAFSSTRLYRFANISSNPNILFNIEAKTLSTDTNLSNNKIYLLAKLKVRANLFLYGTKTPEQVFYSDRGLVRGESAIEHLQQIGPIIEHTYIISNAGPFSVNHFQLIVDWPYESRLVNSNPMLNMKQQEGKHLLYLIEKPTKIPNNHWINVVCSSYKVDELKLGERKPIQKRQAEIEILHKDALIDSSRVATIDCQSNTANCMRINCNFHGDLNKDETISLKFTARLWNATLVEDFSKYEKVLIKSNAKIILNDDVHDHKPNDNENSVATIAYSKISAVVKQHVPLWLYVASVIGGLIIFSVCLLAFWIMGFFERKRYGDDKYIYESEKLKKSPF